MNKFIKLTLCILTLTFILSVISNTFDGDFGWHLRFGQEAWAGNFQYQDHYTWGFFNQNWVNHEWGGDLIFWFLYNNFGYKSLVLFISLALWAAYLITQKIFSKKITVLGLLVTYLCLFASKHIFVMRLAMLSPLLFVVLWYILERVNTKKYIYFLPILFWLWSSLHGSWVLGFITIGIYGAGNLGQILINKYWPEYFKPVWDKKTFLQIIIITVLSALAVLVNPYGTGVWKEVFHYFSSSFYKNHITEWVPSYIFPIYWLSIIIQTVGLFLAVWGAKTKKINLPQLLLMIAFFYSGFLYKRNALFGVIVSLPLIVATLEMAITKLRSCTGFWQEIFNDKKVKKIIKIFFLITLLLLLISYISKIHLTKNVWEDKCLLERNTMPPQSGEFLQKKYPGENRMFNEFRWGGYLNWILPKTLVYFDGRGTATWKTDGEYMLEHYYKIKFEPGGLAELNSKNINLIFLQQSNFFAYTKPDWTDRLMFGKKLDSFFLPEKCQLEKDLENNSEWQLVYSDYMAKIWEKKITP